MDAAKTIESILSESVNRTSKAELRLKDGTVYPPGTHATFRWEQNDPKLTLVAMEGRDVRLRTVRLSKYFPVAKPPGMSVMARWDEDGIAKSVLGHKVEPDGWDFEGSPSWLLVVGMI